MAEDAKGLQQPQWKTYECITFNDTKYNVLHVKTSCQISVLQSDQI